jgi:pimeloyl-ACP methyl ester carboxylesterase
MAQRTEPNLANETWAWAEFVQLLADPIYYGAGVPRGDGRLVVVLPGLFGNDWYLSPMRAWLRRVGYASVPSTLMINAGCPERLTREVERNLTARRRTRAGPVALIGHSRGGILARAIATRLGEDASHLVLLGSPVGAITRWGSASGWTSTAHSGVAAAGTRARRLLDPECDAPFCGCPFPRDMTGRLSPATSVVSIYSREDPIVPAWSCEVPGARNIEVGGTHIGLASNRAVYRALASALNGEHATIVAN